MRFATMFLFPAVLVPGIAGCAPAGAPVPAADNIAKVQLSVRQIPAGSGLKAPCEVTLTERADIAEVIDWLQKIDWSQSGTDLAVVSIVLPDGGIVVTGKDGTTYDFGFYWDGNFILTKANRLIRGGDMAKLRQIIQKACK